MAPCRADRKLSSGRRERETTTMTHGRKNQERDNASRIIADSSVFDRMEDVRVISWDVNSAYLYNSALEAYNFRVRWSNFFESSLFFEPAWDILLYLYIKRFEERVVITKELASASHVPHTTALRWISTLESHGLIERVRCKSDGRIVEISLSAHGVRSIAAFFSRTCGEIIHNIYQNKAT